MPRQQSGFLTAGERLCRAAGALWRKACERLGDHLIKRVIWRRPADYVVGGTRPIMLRWRLLPANRLCSLYLHHFVRSDTGLYHDHPWWSLSLVLKGGYYERTPDADGRDTVRWCPPGTVLLRRADALHLITLPLIYGNCCGVTWQPAYSIMLAGPRVREWGFLCRDGWRRWQDAVSPADKGLLAPGCA